MTEPRWLLVTVTDSSAESRANLGTLLTSVATQAQGADMVLVMRGGGTPPECSGVRIHPVSSPQRIALSTARNLALRHAAERSLLDAADIVAFPDDDARYPGDLMERVAREIGAGVTVLCGAYAPSPEQINATRFPGARRRLSPRLVMRVASSNDVFFGADAVRRLGGFDERFGLGARFGAGEDSDYVLRALRSGYTGLYDPAMLVLHPYKSHRPAEYYAGNVAVLARHLWGGGTGVLLARRLLSGLVMTATGRMTPGDYLRVLRSAVELGRAERPIARRARSRPEDQPEPSSGRRRSYRCRC